MCIRDSISIVSIVCALTSSTSGDKTELFLMFTRTEARKSGMAEMEQPVDGPFGAVPPVRPPLEAAGKQELSPAEPAGPAPVGPSPPPQGSFRPTRMGSETDRKASPRGVSPEMPRRPKRSTTVDRRDAEATQRAGD